MIGTLQAMGMVPMLAHEGASQLGKPGWVLQRKYDGTRVLIAKIDGEVGMVGRSFKNDYSSRYPEIVEEIASIPEKRFILDGELVFFRGAVDVFHTALATEVSKRDFTNISVMLFDSLLVGNRDMRNEPISARLSALSDVVHEDAGYQHLRVVDTFTDPSQFRAIYDAIIAHGGEGVVLKSAWSQYIGGSRDHWLKVKKDIEVDCVVCGITHGTGARSQDGAFGALILAQYNAAGKLVHVGSTSGFDNRTMFALHDVIMGKGDGNGNYVGGLPNVPNPCRYPDERRVKKFVPPALVIRVKAMDRTESGALRHPAFIEVRTDKQPEECVMGV